MIHALSLDTGSDYVELHWTRPRFLPETYQITYMCNLNATSEKDTRDYITKKTQHLSSGTTSFRISHLLPGSNWTLVLLAVYNWASIDSGIVKTGTTFNEGISERNFGWVISQQSLVTLFPRIQAALE